MLYLVYQCEICPNTGNYHVQGYVEFKRSVRMGSAKKILGDNAVHLEPRQGSRDQARNYCMKEESRAPGFEPFEFGEWLVGETKRNALESIVQSIKSGVSWSELAENHTAELVRYYKNLFAVWNHFNTKPRDGTQDVYNIVLHGDAGIGKTRFVYAYANRYGSLPYHGYIGNGTSNWWQNYLGEEWALYDDFDGERHMDVGYFKKICDRYATVVPTKGGSMEYCARINFFTSNVYPIEWFRREHWDAVKRRISHCIWWRSGAVVCETCRDLGVECALVAELLDIVASWE